MNKELFRIFIRFSQRQYDALDYDPFHPIFKYVSDNASKEGGLWASTLFMAFYNDGSAYLAFKNHKPLQDMKPDFSKLPIGLQRRNLRGGLIDKYFYMFNRQVKRYGSIFKFLTHNFTGDKRKDWYLLQETLNSVWGNGRWSSFTLGEMYQKVNGLPVLPCNLMNENSSGPRAGLELLMGKAVSKQKDKMLQELNDKADVLFKRAKKKIKTNIPYLRKGHYDYAMMESQLCDTQSLLKGRYYIGRDIDRSQELIIDSYKVAKQLDLKADTINELWNIRSEVFPHEMLGELNDWVGRDRQALTFYKEYKVIASHKEIHDHFERIGIRNFFKE